MGELIPIMEGFWGTIIPLWLSRNSLSSYERERLFELEQRELLEWTPNTKCVINRVPLWLVSRAFGREARQSVDQQRTGITLHHHPRNPALNKGETASSLLFCNRNCSVVTFQPLKKILHQPRRFFDQTTTMQHPFPYHWARICASNLL